MQWTPLDLLRGNWVGAFIIALATAALMFAMSLGLVFAADPPQTSTHDRVVIAAAGVSTMVTANPFIEGQGEVDGEDGSGTLQGEGTGSLLPLTLSLAAFTLAGWLFTRLTAGYPSVGAALGDALRAAFLFGLVLAIPIAFLHGDESSHLLDSADLGDADSITWGGSGITSFFLGLLMMLGVLVLASVLRADWWHPRLQRIQGWLVTPTWGVLVFLWLLPAAGLIAYLLTWATLEDRSEFDTDGETAMLIAALIAYSGNAGLAFVGAGSGSALSYEFNASEDLAQSESQSEHLKYFADDAPGLWAAPAVMLVVLLIAAMLVRRRSSADRSGLALLTWAGFMLVAVPILARLVTARIDVVIEGTSEIGESERYSVDGWVGITGGQSMLVALIAVVVALAVAVATGATDLRDLARKLQSTPGQSAPSAQVVASPAQQYQQYQQPSIWEANTMAGIPAQPDPGWGVASRSFEAPEPDPAEYPAEDPAENTDTDTDTGSDTDAGQQAP